MSEIKYSYYCYVQKNLQDNKKEDFLEERKAIKDVLKDISFFAKMLLKALFSKL